MYHNRPINMKRLFVIVSAVMLLASCESNRSTFVDVEDGKMFVLECGHYNQFIAEGDTIIYARKLTSARARGWEQFYGIYKNKALPLDIDWDHFNKEDSTYTYSSTTYHIATKVSL